MKDLKQVFTQADFYFEWYDHEPIFTYEGAEAMKAEKGFWGTETKSLYLKDKKKRHYVYLTLPEKQVDFKALKEATGLRLTIEKTDVMEIMTGQEAGAVSPLGYEEETPLIFDKELLGHEKLVFAPGTPCSTIVVKSSDLEKICQVLGITFISV